MSGGDGWVIQEFETEDDLDKAFDEIGEINLEHQSLLKRSESLTEPVAEALEELMSFEEEYGAFLL